MVEGGTGKDVKRWRAKVMLVVVGSEAQQDEDGGRGVLIFFLL